MEYDQQTYRLSKANRFGQVALVIGVVGLSLSVVGWILQTEHFLFSWLVSFVFWLSIGLGGLFLTMLHHLVGANWSTAIRRITESLAIPLPFMAAMAVPIVLGVHGLYHWSHEEAMLGDELLRGKQGYLNVGFFSIRAIAYFAIWTLLSLMLWRVSRRQDTEPSPGQIATLRKISAPGMIIFAVTLTFAGFDWLMSLDPHWYSTIFGVYLFAGALTAVISFILLTTITLRAKGVLQGVITKEHDHDLGKLLFAFTIFWGYMAFSQYFLIWYGNIPEETIWFLHRWEGSWQTVTLALVFGHFVIPFFALFPQEAKRNRKVLVFVSVWMLLMHWLDLYWIVMPTLYHHGVHLSWIDAAAFVGIGGLFCAAFWRIFISGPVVPASDPTLEHSIKHHS